MQYAEIELGGKNRKLRYDFNAISDLEEKAQTGIMQLMAEDRMGFGTIRLLVWAGLKWEEKGLTLQRAGDMIQKCLEDGGDLAKIMEPVSKALEQGMAWVNKTSGNVMTEAAN